VAKSLFTLPFIPSHQGRGGSVFACLQRLDLSSPKVLLQGGLIFNLQFSIALNFYRISQVGLDYLGMALHHLRRTLRDLLAEIENHNPL
jgi:hypothetical protein